jgi:glycosyltransferase involved in cell wall biosynthesis
MAANDALADRPRLSCRIGLESTSTGACETDDSNRNSYAQGVCVFTARTWRESLHGDFMLGITWQLSEIHGWGLVGVHTSLYLMDRGTPPVVLTAPAFSTMRPNIRAKLETLYPSWEIWQQVRQAQCEKTVRWDGLNVVHGLGNNTQPGELQAWGKRNIGMIFFEDMAISSSSVDLLKQMDVVVTGSRFNELYLKDLGLTDVRMLWQGVDPTEMIQLPRDRTWGGRFVVFSGGKLEFRKGQDIVLAGFRRFLERHPDALLLTAWHSPWPELALTMAQSPFLSVAPELRDGRIQVDRWASENGIPSRNVLDLGVLPRSLIAQIMAKCDVAVFPNRCEGGTNLVAMEALACGVPTIAAANSGQLDLLEWGEICWPLTRQTSLPNKPGWGESDPDELAAAMEDIYDNGAEVEQRRANAVCKMSNDLTWTNFAAKFASVCDG